MCTLHVRPPPCTAACMPCEPEASHPAAHPAAHLLVLQAQLGQRGLVPGVLQAQLALHLVQLGGLLGRGQATQTAGKATAAYENRGQQQAVGMPARQPAVHALLKSRRMHHQHDISTTSARLQAHLLRQALLLVISQRLPLGQLAVHGALRRRWREGGREARSNRHEGWHAGRASSAAPRSWRSPVLASTLR